MNKTEQIKQIKIAFLFVAEKFDEICNDNIF